MYAGGTVILPASNVVAHFDEDAISPSADLMLGLVLDGQLVGWANFTVDCRR